MRADLASDLDKTIGGKVTVEIDGEEVQDTIEDYETGEHPDQPVLFELEETGKIVNHRELINFEKSKEQATKQHLENAVEELEKAKNKASDLEGSQKMIRIDSRRRSVKRMMERVISDE